TPTQLTFPQVVIMRAIPLRMAIRLRFLITRGFIIIRVAVSGTVTFPISQEVQRSSGKVLPSMSSVRRNSFRVSILQISPPTRFLQDSKSTAQRIFLSFEKEQQPRRLG